MFQVWSTHMQHTSVSQKLSQENTYLKHDQQILQPIRSASSRKQMPSGLSSFQIPIALCSPFLWL